MIKIKKNFFVVLFVFVSLLTSCLAENPGLYVDSGYSSNSDFFDINSTEIHWLTDKNSFVLTTSLVLSGGNGLRSIWWLTVSRSFISLEIKDDDKVCLSVFISPSQQMHLTILDFNFVYDGVYYDGLKSFYDQILNEVICERDPDLYERWEMIQTPVSKREEEKDYSFTEEEIEEANRYYEECRILAENDERYKAGQAEYERQIREFQEATKRNISKYLVYEKLFTDYGFEIAARYNDGGVLDRYLIDSQCPFAIIGTKEMIVDFVNNVIPEGREETTGMYFAFGELPDPKTIDP